MKIFLFVIEGTPGYRLSLAEAQACLEDHLRDRRDVSDVWWDDENPYEARVYLYGASHSDYEADVAAGVDPNADWETTGQLIWPVTLPDSGHTRKQEEVLPFGGAELSLTIRTDHHKEDFLRVIPDLTWSDNTLRPLITMNFAVNAAQALIDRWTSKERT